MKVRIHKWTTSPRSSSFLLHQREKQTKMIKSLTQMNSVLQECVALKSSRILQCLMLKRHHYTNIMLVRT